MERNTKAKITVFEEADGFHWNIKSRADAAGYLDARGPAYPTRRKARQAAKNYIEANGSVWR